MICKECAEPRHEAGPDGICESCAFLARDRALMKFRSGDLVRVTYGTDRGIGEVHGVVTVDDYGRSERRLLVQFHGYEESMYALAPEHVKLVQ